MLSHSALTLTASPVLLAGLAGCQSYQPQPLDEPASRHALLGRSPASPDVAAFAASLAPDPSRPAFDPADGLTLPEAEIVAIVYNPDLRLARLKAGVAQASAEHAGHWEDPSFGIDLTRILASVDHAWKLGVPLGLTIPLSGRLDAEVESARAEHRAELVRVAQAEWAVRVSLRQAWADWTATTRRVDVLAGFLTHLERVAEIVDRMEAAGEMPRVEARLFRLERAGRRADLAERRAAAAEAELNLKTTLGLPPTAELSAIAGPGFKVERESVELLRARSSSTSLDLAMARAEYEVAERELAREIAGQYPDLSFGPGYGREDGNDEVTVGIGFTLPLWNRNQRAIAEARGRREFARAEFDAAIARIESRLSAADIRSRAAAERRRAFESDIIPMVDQQYAEARRIAELGEVSTLVLLESLKVQLEAKLSLIDADQTQQLADIELDAVAGPAVRTTTQPTPSTEAAK